MADNNRNNPYSPLVVPGDFTGTLRNFGIHLSRIITDIYLKLTKQSEKIKNQSEELNSFIYGGSLPNNTALNTVVEPGFYHLFWSNRTFTDTPPDGGTINLLLVSRPAPNASTILQIGFGINNIYYRFRVDATTWGNWRKVSATAVT